MPADIIQVSQPRTMPLPLLTLAGGVAIVSWAAILVRLLQQEGVATLSIAALRLTLAALILTPWVLLRHRQSIAALSLPDLLAALAAGAFLAAHFWSWMASLGMTSVASSVALVTTNPIWIALASWLLFGERLGRLAMLGVALAILGSALIFLSDAAGTQGSAPMQGNLLALLGSVTVCGYLLIGRGLRKKIDLWPYVWLVYGTASALLLLLALLSATPLAGFSGRSWLWLVLLAVGPQLLGHSAFNWALRHVSATLIAVAILGEPIGSALLAWWIFGEGFRPLQLAGFAVLLLGIGVAARAWRGQGG
jgi:drug/metabolite transporter (DMT)-like permease